MADRIRWGILGTGNIARQFCAGVLSAQRSALTAVGSRSNESASAFARVHHIPTAYGSYEKLLADANVDAVYNSLPNSLHHQWTIAALEAGKHVLCEKPFAVDTAQALEMFDVARKAGAAGGGGVHVPQPSADSCGAESGGVRRHWWKSK